MKKNKLTATLLFVFSTVFCSLVLWNTQLYNQSWRQVSAEAESIPVIVIDAGHGGIDGGATAKDGTMEKDINLQIAVKLKEIMENYPLEIVLTRSEDTDLAGRDEGSIHSRKRQDLLVRKEIIAAAAPLLAVSIHLNSFPQNELVYGAQVFYPKEEVQRTDGRAYEHTAKDFAESVQKAIEIGISDGRERSAMTKNDILLFEEPACPMILVECGFLSNSDEADKLKSSEYQEQIALAIWEGINEKLCLKETPKMEIIESENKDVKKLKNSLKNLWITSS